VLSRGGPAVAWADWARERHGSRNVVVTVNDHFRGGVGTLTAHGRLTAPLSQFQTGLGQRFDVGRQSVVKIDVTATDDKEQPVRLEWGAHKR